MWCKADLPIFFFYSRTPKTGRTSQNLATEIIIFAWLFLLHNLTPRCFSSGLDREKCVNTTISIPNSLKFISRQPPEEQEVGEEEG